MTQSLAQQRAKDALGKIRALEEGHSSAYGKYVSYVKALPATNIMSGLGQAMAMEKAGKDVGHKLLYQHMNDWLCKKWRGSGNPSDILTAITEGDEDAYIHSQAEAMEYLEWLKKFAVALLVDEENADKGSKE